MARSGKKKPEHHWYNFEVTDTLISLGDGLDVEVNLLESSDPKAPHAQGSFIVYPGDTTSGSIHWRGDEYHGCLWTPDHDRLLALLLAQRDLILSLSAHKYPYRRERVVTSDIWYDKARWERDMA